MWISIHLFLSLYRSENQNLAFCNLFNANLGNTSHISTAKAGQVNLIHSVSKRNGNKTNTQICESILKRGMPYSSHIWWKFDEEHCTYWPRFAVPLLHSRSFKYISRPQTKGAVLSYSNAPHLKALNLITIVVFNISHLGTEYTPLTLATESKMNQ